MKAYFKARKLAWLLPADARPPIDLNQELMKKWRDLMGAFYLDPHIQ
jgi:hypothetical protein